MNQVQELVMVVSTVEWESAFHNFVDERGGSAHTRKAILQDLRNLSAWYTENYHEPFSPERLTGRDVRSYRGHLILNEKAPATINRALASIRIFAAWGMAAGYLSFDPSKDIEGVQQVESPPRWLSEAELHKFLRQCELLINGAPSETARRQAVRDYAMVSLMVFAGLREGELAALKVSDIGMSERKGKVIVRLGKGEKHREIPLNLECRKALELWIGKYSPAGMLFDGKGSAGMTTRTVQRRVSQIGHACGLQVSPHDLRHTFAKRLVNQGVPLTVVQRLLGHARLDTTGRYARPGWEDFEDAVEKL